MGRERSIKRLAATLAAIALGSPAALAGVDSRAYSCAGLQALIAQHRFVFIDNPDFEDFAVSDASMCASGEIVEWRSVPTADRPACVVSHCETTHGAMGIR